MGYKPEMGAIQPVRLYGEGDQSVTVTPEGKLSVDAQVTAEVADSKIKGSTDAGTTWVPVRVNSSGQLEVALSGQFASDSFDFIRIDPMTTVDIQEWPSGEYDRFRLASYIDTDSHNDITYTMAATTVQGNYGTDRRLFLAYPIPLTKYDTFSGSVSGDIPIHGTYWKLRATNNNQSGTRTIRRLCVRRFAY